MTLSFIDGNCEFFSPCFANLILFDFFWWNSHVPSSQSSFHTEMVAEKCWKRKFIASNVAKFSSPCTMVGVLIRKEVSESYLHIPFFLHVPYSPPLWKLVRRFWCKKPHSKHLFTLYSFFFLFLSLFVRTLFTILNQRWTKLLFCVKANYANSP